MTQLQARDLCLLRTVTEHRVVSLTQAAALHFEGRYEAAAKRLQKLRRGGFLAAYPRRVGDACLLRPTRRTRCVVAAAVGGAARATDREIGRKSKPLATNLVSHELAVVDARIAIGRACHAAAASLQEFIPRPHAHAFQTPGPTPTGGFRPDAYLSIETRSGRRQHFFLELDRSTEPGAVLAAKMRRYQAFDRSGAFAVARGGLPAERARYPFRVLFVVPSPERRDNLARLFGELTPPVRTQAYLATAADLAADPVGAIWHCPIDCVTRHPAADRPVPPPGSRRSGTRGAADGAVTNPPPPPGRRLID